MPLKLQQHDEIQLNLTPMIDVLFLLIIFFMVAARFGDMQRSVDLQLPKVTQGGASNAPPEPLEVQVRSDGQVELQTKVVSLPVLIDTLRSKMAASTETEVLISGDARCDFQYVAATLAACREAGVTKVGVTVEIAQTVGSGQRAVGSIK